MPSKKTKKSPSKYSYYLTEQEKKLFAHGKFDYSYKKFGARAASIDGEAGAFFTVWAPNANRVSVIGEFNEWVQGKHSLELQGNSGIWQGFVAGVKQGQLYKYYIESKYNEYCVEKADPYAFAAEVRPRTASRLWDINAYQWQDTRWLVKRTATEAYEKPMNIYELHLSSWRHFPHGGAAAQEYLRNDGALPPVTYRDLGQSLPLYLNEMGFTHVELMPVMEYPCDSSWGYQLTGYYAPTSRYGTPDDFKYLIDQLHQHGIGVILDVVPAHFAIDGHGLVYFDGTHLYEHADWRQGYQPDWGTYLFNFSRAEVRNFLISHMLFWLDVYHIDGLRIDAVAAMLYLNYSRREGEWIPNINGGNENIEAVAFIKQLNETLYREVPGIVMFAEESTAWPLVSRPTDKGGLGFGMKWNMGWMHDVLAYMHEDPYFRHHHHNQLTFGMLYAFNENFVLPFSHDEVVHGKGSMIRKMPGHFWERFANLRALLGFMYSYPGKKLLFNGIELADWDEWWFKRTINWGLLEYPLHQGMQSWVKDLNHFLLTHPALYEVDFEQAGFEWIDCKNAPQNILSFLRFSKHHKECLLCVCNFSPLPYENFKIGVPYQGQWQECLNSDRACYGGSDRLNNGTISTIAEWEHHRPFHIEITVPPLGCVLLARKLENEEIK
ncbi:MAG: 1,4-alpha-glucan branching protein GlgB [Deltaproteobacteria bacterium]|nr:1,4-alpha-glucan branching protein GlgB [Deltaproteobacteria bacterium]